MIGLSGNLVIQSLENSGSQVSHRLIPMVKGPLDKVVHFSSGPFLWSHPVKHPSFRFIYHKHWGEIPGQDGYSAYTIASYGVLFGIIATHLKNRAQLARLAGTIVRNLPERFCVWTGYLLPHCCCTSRS
jgi:hypothetical protein